MYAKVIHIPNEQETIQSGIDAAADNDTILVAPGDYFEHVELNGKTLTLASWFLTTGDTSYVRQTVIDGNDSGQIIYIDKDVGPLTLITGLTIQNADDGIACEARVQILHNRFQGCKDAIDYEKNSGGVCSYNVFENNKDDAIDLDDNVDIKIEANVIVNNKDDGIEIRLYDYTGPLLTCIIRNNIISGNGEDGIQFIDYKELSDRVFYIEHNLICNNDMVGLGCMGNQNTTENYEGAAIPEPIYVINNTFVNNHYGITGGASLVALNNIFLKHTGTAIKNVKNHSIVSYGAFWENGADMDSCNVQPVIINENPLLDENYRLMQDSPCIDRGTAFFVWQGDTVLNLSNEDYLGLAPDIGAFEFEISQTGTKDNFITPTTLELYQNYPNPFNPVTNIRYVIPAAGFVKMDIYDITGRRVSTLVDGFSSPGKYSVTWNAKDGREKPLPSGLYFCRLQVGSEWKTIKLILIE
ncbi:right-handed parallel beta-helix repeat-containing protein [candidate division KSB1 bacterium]|nr:right-handed parallel beta-helix repeat-containing protein [candidate division KSB1 bacterium]